jgi:hypothetical protein
LVLSPTGSINLGFILREDLLLCSSYLPLGLPNWAVMYTPSLLALVADLPKRLGNTHRKAIKSERLWFHVHVKASFPARLSEASYHFLTCVVA